MMGSWVEDEVKTTGFGDQRLDRRFGEVLAQFGARPTASIPAACGGRAEMEAAYRFFDNEKFPFQQVLQPHREATERRIDEQAVAIVAQDTTEIFELLAGGAAEPRAASWIVRACRNRSVQPEQAKSTTARKTGLRVEGESDCFFSGQWVVVSG